MNTVNLNLARKWRSKNFDQIVGQDLSVKMLKNSLYLGSYFPVYLFSGQRGCGKTSLARVFAAAVNCNALADFQKKPTVQAIPCLACPSCIAMSTGAHPDFVEIDAASHTGVDMIRQVIDASNLLPVMGIKKIYLIDEAHMLSKASFNALLKVLEEPPQSVLFILATTDAQKIVETVRSRCFQLFFKAIGSSLLTDHLKQMCEKESIAFDSSGLALIVNETQGSARDAINLLEQVRFASSVVNKQAVLTVLGHVSDEELIALLKIVLHGNPASLLSFLQEKAIQSMSVDFVYKQFMSIVRAAVWIKYGVVPNGFKQHASTIKQVIAQSSGKQLNALFQTLGSHDLALSKTVAKYELFEMILLQLCQKNNRDDDTNGAPSTACAPSISEESSVDIDDAQQDDDQDDEQDEDEQAQRWKSFVGDVQTLNDPLMLSVFSQGHFVSYDQTGFLVHVAFSKELSFFKDWVDNTIALWQPLLNKAFQAVVKANLLFTLETKGRVSTPPAKPAQDPVPDVIMSRAGAPVAQRTERNFRSSRVNNATARTAVPEPVLDVSDVNIWQKTNMILGYFPGSVTEIKEQGVRYE